MQGDRTSSARAQCGKARSWKGYFCYIQTTQWGHSQGKRGLSHLTKSTAIQQQYLPPWAQVSLLLGHWGCGAGLLWEESQPAGVKWSWVKCLKGTHDPGALIARDRTAGTRQSFPGPQDVPKVLGGSWGARRSQIYLLRAYAKSAPELPSPAALTAALQCPSSSILAGP